MTRRARLRLGLRWRITLAVTAVFAVASVSAAALLLERVEGALLASVRASTESQLLASLDDSGDAGVIRTFVVDGDGAVVQEDRRELSGWPGPAPALLRTGAGTSGPLVLLGADVDGDGAIAAAEALAVGGDGGELRDLKVEGFQLESADRLVPVLSGDPAAGCGDCAPLLLTGLVGGEGQLGGEGLVGGSLLAEVESFVGGMTLYDDGPDRVAVASPMLQGDSPAEQRYVVTSQSLNVVTDGVDALRLSLVVVIPLTVLAVGLLTWVATGRSLQPVDALTTRVRSIGGDAVHERVPEPGTGDEIDDLAQTMNSMLARLERAVTSQRQFVDDAAHELRNPLATIGAELELAGARPETVDWPARVADLRAEHARMDALVEDLLLLAREDAGRSRSGVPGGRAVTVDVDDVVRSERDRVAGRWPGRRVDTSAVVPVQVTGDPGPLARMVGNLLDNAARHARREVRVTLSAAAGRARLVVDDDGAGIAPADRERVFERFTRLDDARARDSGGSGLGLAIVAAVVRAHRGSVAVSAAELGGARFVVELPEAPPDAP